MDKFICTLTAHRKTFIPPKKKKKNMIKVKAMVSYLDVFCKSEQNEESVKKDKSIACSTTIH